MRRVASNNIIHLKEDEVFVFGSNLSGIHGAGAAKKALEFGALWRNPIGIQGNTYAIPTKDVFIETLPLYQIKPYINQFIGYAKANQNKIFLLTEIGCGLAGYTSEEIAPMFESCKELENVYLPLSFWEVLK